MIALALDLGSTRIKAARLDRKGRVEDVRAVAAPALRGRDPIREGDAEAYADAALALLRAVAANAGRAVPLGIATQRSSFVVWRREDGAPRTPLVSWQDRRAAAWCERRRALAPEIVRHTGLPLSPHYAGPKLAAMQEADPGLARLLSDGEHLFGTLETFLAWRWSGGRVHETDLSVAARTLLVDLRTRTWSDELLARFGVPREVLPAIVATAGRAVPLDPGPRLAATVADQAAGALALLEPSERSVLVNVGTGAFVLRPAAGAEVRCSGYLTAPVYGDANGARFTLEGTINGGGPALDRFGSPPTALPQRDPAPAAFAIPDLAGLGSPHWRPAIGLTLSDAALALDEAGQRRVVLEGLLFRIAEILGDLFGSEPPDRVLLAGGASADPALAAGLATLVGRPVERLLEAEGGLAGAARLAAGLPPCLPGPMQHTAPGAARYLQAKYPRWREWLYSTGLQK